MPGWILTIILVLISGLAGLAVGFVLGYDEDHAEEWRRNK